MLDREQWDNADETRRAVKRRLINWGWHYRGGGVNLGYPDHQPFTTPPARVQARPPEYIGQDDADRVEYLITSGAQASLVGLRNLIILKTEYVTGYLTQESRAKSRGLSVRTYLRRVADADFWFYRRSRESDT